MSTQYKPIAKCLNCKEPLDPALSKCPRCGSSKIQKPEDRILSREKKTAFASLLGLLVLLVAINIAYEKKSYNILTSKSFTSSAMAGSSKSAKASSTMENSRFSIDQRKEIFNKHSKCVQDAKIRAETSCPINPHLHLATGSTYSLKSEVKLWATLDSKKEDEQEEAFEYQKLIIGYEITILSSSPHPVTKEKYYQVESEQGNGWIESASLKGILGPVDTYEHNKIKSELEEECLEPLRQNFNLTDSEEAGIILEGTGKNWFSGKGE